MYVLIDTIGDNAGRSITLAYASDVATVLRGWYPEAPDEIFEAIAELQTALNNGDPTDAYETYLGITVEHAPWPWCVCDDCTRCGCALPWRHHADPADCVLVMEPMSKNPDEVSE